MLNRRRLLAALSVGLLLAVAVPALAAAPYVSGTYVSDAGQGTIRFTPLRAVVQFGYEGNFVVNGRRYPGSLYGIRGTANVGLVWYYGVTGIPAGNAVVSPAGGTTYSGPIQFTSRAGAVTAAGTATVDIVAK
ncbi:MAG: hypothetical protein U0802_24135 [Candidatus Binatia bacterium]